MVAHCDANDVAADLDDLARRLVTQRHAAVMARDTAHRDEKRVGTADSAGPDLYEDIRRPDGGLRRVDHPCLPGRCHDGNLHVHAPLRGKLVVAGDHGRDIAADHLGE